MTQVNPVSTHMRRLAVVPSDPLEAYVEKGRGDLLKDYYNPGSYFDEVYCLSPREKTGTFMYGMHIIPTSPEQLPTRIQELGIDIVRAYGGYWACDMACENKVEGVPVVVSVHDTNPKLLHDSILNADYVLPMSNAVRELLLNKNVSPERIHDFTNRVDFRLFYRCCDEKLRAEFYARYSGKYRILHVGRKVEEKNLDTLIRALAELGPEYVCIFVGKGCEDTYRKLAEQCGVGQQCYFIPSVHNGELFQYYSFCDCMCTPSRWEGFGIVFIEALACEAVVVTSDIAPMNEYITNNVNGILVKNFESPTAIAEAIVQACTNESLRHNIQSNAREAAEPFGKEKIDQLEVNLYKQFLNGSVEKIEINTQVTENILNNNPWYVGSQFEWAEKPYIKRIYERRRRFFIECINRTKERLGTKIRVLDAGCGDGYWLWKLRDVENVELIGVDYNPLRVDRARQVVPEITVYHCDLMNFTSEEPFDIVLLSQVIEHIEDDVGLLSKTRSLLRDEGILILGTPNEGSYLHQKRNGRLGASSTTDHVHSYTEQEIASKLQQAGFTIQSIMREVFYVGDDDLYYTLLETQWGFELLDFMTFLVPSECSDFYFECRVNTTKNPPKSRFHPSELPTVQEIAQKLKEFWGANQKYMRLPRGKQCQYPHLKLDGTESSEMLQQKQSTQTRSPIDRQAHYLSRLPAYRVLTEANLGDESVRKSPELAVRLRTAGIKDTNLENYWKRVEFIAQNCFGRVLELGCGCGNITRYISQNNTVTHVCAIDMLREYIDQLRVYAFDKVEPICADALTYEFSGKFDCVVIAELIEHLTLEQEEGLIQKLQAVLVPGARLIITTPVGFMPDPDHIRGFTTSEFQEHLRQYYGRIVKTDDNGIQQFAVVDFKPFSERKLAPKVSVVLPTYNHLRFLPKAAESVLAQTFSDFELIIVNDGSTDGTREYLDTLKDPRIRIIGQENKHLPEALNAGFRTARGELLTWISSDNYCAPTFLETFVAALDANPDVGFAYSAYAWINEEGQIVGKRENNDVSLHNLLVHNAGTASFMYRRACQEKVGLYDPELEGAEDWDMWLRIIEQFQTVYVPEILYYYRHHKNSMTEEIPEKIRRAGQQVFQKALKRRNNRLDMLNLYPTLASCKDHETAKFYAYFDFGTALLEWAFAPAKLPCQMLEGALSLSPDSLEAAGNLAVAHARSARWEKVIPLLRQMIKRAENPKVLNLCRTITEAHKTNNLDMLTKKLLFKTDKESVELFQLEKKNKRVFSFTDAGQQKRPSSPSISVVIPCYNTGNYLGEAIESVLAQTYGNFEVIVVDDGSTDATPQVVHSFDDKRIRYIYQENKGLAGARNTGIRHSRGQYLAFLDADDYFLPNKLTDQVAFLESHPEFGLVAGGHLRIDQNGRVIKEYKLRSGEVSVEQQLVNNHFLIHNTLIRRTWVERAGCFDGNLRGGEEWDFYCRLAIAGCRMIYQPDNLVCAYRFLRSSLSTDLQLQINSKLKVVEKIFSDESLPSRLAKLRPKATGYLYLAAAVSHYALGMVDDGREYLAKALRLDPDLRDNDYERILQFFIHWIDYRQIDSPVEYFESVFDSLPEEAQDMQRLREHTLDKVRKRGVATQPSDTLSKNSRVEIQTEFPECMVRGAFLPPMLTFDVINRCNVSCTMCLEAYKYENADKKPPLRQLTVDELNEKLTGVGHIQSAILCGGHCEPFLNKEIIEIISVLKGKKASVSAISNGTLINKAMAEKIIRAGLNSLHISLHGATKKTAEQIMRGASFEKVISNIRELIRLKETLSSPSPSIRILCVGMKRNICELSELVALMGQMGVKSVVLKSLMERQKQDFAALKGQSLIAYPELLRKEYERAQITAKEYNVHLSANDPYNTIITDAGHVNNPEKKQSEHMPLHEGKTRYCLFPFLKPSMRMNGRVALCCSESGGAVCMGDASESSFASVWDNDAYIKLRTALLAGENIPSYCDKCDRSPMVDPIVMQMEIALRQAQNNIKDSQAFVQQNEWRYPEYIEALKGVGGVPQKCIYRDTAVLQKS